MRWLIAIYLGLYSAMGVAALEGKKVLYLDSYHPGYEWSDGILRGVKSVLSDTGVLLEVHYMDTKRNQELSFIENAGREAKQKIDEFKPDVLIAADDNASEFLVMPFYRNADLPVVFCGVNWDEKKYGYPYSNTTGMVEVDPIEPMLEYFAYFTKGDRFAYVSGDTLTDHVIYREINERYFAGKLQFYVVKDFSEYRQLIKRIQHELDGLILNNNVGIAEWDHQQAVAFSETEIVIPTSTTAPWMAEYTLFAVAKFPDEQGAWAARAALDVLEGKRVDQIPLTTNRFSILTANMRIAKQLGVTFSLDDLQRARLIK